MALGAELRGVRLWGPSVSVLPTLRWRPTNTRSRQVPQAVADRPAGKADRPAKKADRPAGKADRPARKADRPAGKADRPAGKGQQAVQKKSTPPKTDSVEEEQRLSKVLAAAGVASRRACEDLIDQGTVVVNGAVVKEQGTKVNPRTDKIVVNGKKIATAKAPRLYYFAVNKPKGYVCSNIDTRESDQEGRRAVDLLQPWVDGLKDKAGEQVGTSGTSGSKATALPPRLFTVGRLDINTYGLMFITNDGHWAQKVIHPSSGLSKEYIVNTSRRPSRVQLERIMQGVEIEGVLVSPLTVSTLEDKRTRVVVTDGRKHEVRLLVEAAELEVTSLKRVRVGGFRLDRMLGLGQYKQLTSKEAQQVLDLKKQDKLMESYSDEPVKAPKSNMPAAVQNLLGRK